jgi:Bacterial SH3 domain
MPSTPPNSPNFKNADMTGESEEFILPKPPPPYGKPSGDNAQSSAALVSPKAHSEKLSPVQGHEASIQEVQLGEPSCEKAKEHEGVISPTTTSKDSEPGRSGLIGVILVLLLMIVGLLIFIADSKNGNVPPINSTTPNHVENDAEQKALLSENQSLRTQMAGMTAQAKLMKEQVESSRDAMAKAVWDLHLANSASKNESALLRAEIAHLKNLLQNSRPPLESTPNVREAPAEPQVAGTAYRVSGLREGDTLNVRSGPGSGFQVVAQLFQGKRITVTGAAVANGDDLWLPCYTTGKVTDPSTGATKPSTATGWISAAFVEQDE